MVLCALLFPVAVWGSGALEVRSEGFVLRPNYAHTHTQIPSRLAAAVTKLTFTAPQGKSLHYTIIPKLTSR